MLDSGRNRFWRETGNLVLVALVSWVACGEVVAAQAGPVVEYRLQSQDLGDALNEFALQSGSEILFDEEEVAGKRSDAVVGGYEAQQALSQLLAKSGIRFQIDELGTYLVGNNFVNGESSNMKVNDGVRSLAAGVATAFAVAIGAVSAEEKGVGSVKDQANIIEEVVVTGIRGSMQKSLDRKRNADQFIDAITAEDIGAFPETNIAEALQRVAGVAIDRKEGEGSFVSVRGLGPQFVQSTLNGRVMASNTDGGDQGGSISGIAHNGSRAVAYDQFQSGLVNAVEVRKSPRADDIEGGLGGVINTETRRPLDLGERRTAFSADMTYLELADDTGNGFFGMFSDVLSDTVGIMLSAQYDDRPSRNDGATVYGWTVPETFTVGGQTLTGSRPQQFNAAQRTLDRQRLNVSGALQWQPSDRINVDVDALFTRQEVDEREIWQEYRYGDSLRQRLTAARVESSEGQPFFTSISTSGGAMFIQDADEVGETETQVFGIGVDFQATDKLNIGLDLSVSAADGSLTTRRSLGRNANTQMTYNTNRPGGLPTFTSTSPITDPARYSVVLISDQLSDLEDQLVQLRTDATYTFDGGWLNSVSVGARWEQQKRDDKRRSLTSRVFANRPASEVGGTVPFPDGDFLNGTGINSALPGVIPNLDGWHHTLTSRAAEVAAGNCNQPPAFCSLTAYRTSPNSEDINHEADTIAAYVMADFGGDLGRIPYSGNVGVRYVATDTKTSGILLEFLGIDFSDPGQPLIRTGAPFFSSVSHDYNEVLPSLNVSFDLRDDLILRSSVGKVLSRPSFNDLNPRQSFAPINRLIVAGNAELEPTTAWQIDLALEWYFSEYSLVSAGVFMKDIKDFVTIQLTPAVIPNIIDPATGQPLVLTERKPVNATDSDLTGMELSLQHTFENLPAPFNGFGVMANYTYIDSSTDFVNAITRSTVGIPGLSENTFNATLFYENQKFSARVSYNLRSKFVEAVPFAGAPSMVDDYHQIDAQVSYFLNDKVSFSLEGLNLTDEVVDRFVVIGDAEAWLNLSNTGPRYTLSVNIKL